MQDYKELPEDEPEKRLSFDIPESLHNRVKQAIPWGVQSRFFRALVEIAISKIEKGGYAVIGGILSGDLDPFRKEDL